MTTYILLRKNKESGPFNLEELRVLGILPDDLFWVEGQSVCWQNPGEIKELKSLVGKSPEKQAEDLTNYQPAQKTSFVSETFFQDTETKVAPVHLKKDVSTDYIISQKNISVSQVFKEQAKKDLKEPETRYSKPLDEIKEIYLKNLERQQQPKKFALQIPAPVKKIAPYAAFLVTGIIAGLLINKPGKTKKNTEKIQQPAPLTITAKPAVSPENQITATELPVEESKEVIPGKENIQNEITEEPGTAISAEKKQAPEKKSKQPETAGNGNKNNSISKTDEPPPLTQAAKTESVPASVHAEDISSLVSVKTNDYQVGSFGGIRNLQLTVKNDSKYILNEVTVELQYLKPMDEVIRSESIHFYSVPPRGTQTLPVAKSNRGVKVICKVVRVESKEAVVNTSGSN